MANRLLLPFGNARANTFTSEESFVAALRDLERPVADFSFRGPAHNACLTGVRVGGLVISAASTEAMHAKCLVDPQVAFILPFAGSGKIIHRRSVRDWTANRMIIRNCYDEEEEFATSGSTVVTLRVAFDRLQSAVDRVIRDRTGTDGHSAEEICARLFVRGPVIDAGVSWTVDYCSALMKLVTLVDECRYDEDLLQRIGIEDMVIRLLARLVLDQEYGAVTDLPPLSLPRSQRAVDLICDRIRSSIGTRLTMSDMEDMTGLTGRALNYAFRARHGCSPQEWQRNFLLDQAHRLLKSANCTLSLKALAYEFGFASPSSFTAFYRQRFGELPSQTFARHARSSGGKRVEESLAMTPPAQDDAPVT